MVLPVISILIDAPEIQGSISMDQYDLVLDLWIKLDLY